jgi:hypothetical protein
VETFILRDAVCINFMKVCQNDFSFHEGTRERERGGRDGGREGEDEKGIIDVP